MPGNRSDERTRSDRRAQSLRWRRACEAAKAIRRARAEVIRARKPDKLLQRSRIYVCICRWSLVTSPYEQYNELGNARQELLAVILFRRVPIFFLAVQCVEERGTTILTEVGGSALRSSRESAT